MNSEKQIAATLRTDAGKSISSRDARRIRCDVCLAIPEFDRLKRYERRAWSRRNRALRAFMTIKSRADKERKST
jgi:hypothetical protein